MKMRIFFTIITVLSAIPLLGQQDAMFTHYMQNTLAVNPAYAGSRDALTVTGLHRSQWTGFDGAPITQTLTIHSPILSKKFGVGFSVLNDQIGPLKYTSLYTDLAYALQMNKRYKLSFGLKGGINITQANLAGLRLNEDQDQAFQNNIENKVLPNFGFGVYYYSSTWYFGFSSPTILENDYKLNGNSGTISKEKESRHYYFITGTVIALNKALKLKPTTLIKTTPGSPLQGEITCMLIVYDGLEFGTMFRTGDAAGVLLGYNFNNRLNVGYSFDWSYKNTTFTYNNGSHEILVRYDFIFHDKSKVRSPRYF